MLIEIAGCTSSGKTRLLVQVLVELDKRGLKAILAYDDFLSAHRISLNHHKLRSLAVDALLVPWLPKVWKKYRDYIKIVSRMSLRRKDTLFMRLNIFRNFLKKLCLHEYFGRSETNNVLVFLDEGTVHTLNNVFSHYDKAPDLAQLSKILKYLPLPDVIVRVDAPIVTIVSRAVRRENYPWQHLDRRQLCCLAENTNKIYQFIEKKRDLQEKRLVIVTENSHPSLEKQNVRRVVNYLASHIG